MTGLAIAHLLIGGALAALGLNALLNRVALPRLERFEGPTRGPRVSVLIPARNEAGRIGASVGGWTAQAYADFEVIVYDDDSTDDTMGVARAAAGAGAALRVARGGEPPAGWRGKPWACHCLRGLARGDVLVFADADVRPAPSALPHLVGALGTLGADVISAVPAHHADGAVLQALAGLQNWAALAVLPSWLRPGPRRPWLAALNGQLIVLRTETYDASGGFPAVRDSLAEDVALGRRLAALGRRVRLVDGACLLSCRPFTTLAAAWRANTRNLVPIFFGSPVLLVLTLGAALALYAGPLAMLAAGLGGDSRGTWGWTWLPLAEVALGTGVRAAADRRSGQRWWLALLQPLAVGGLAAMGFAAAVRAWLGGRVEWRGRRYDAAS